MSSIPPEATSFRRDYLTFIQDRVFSYFYQIYHNEIKSLQRIIACFQDDAFKQCHTFNMFDIIMMCICLFHNTLL